jgi:hypothetical protein
MKKYKYLVGYRGDNNVMYGKYHIGVNQDRLLKPPNEDFSHPMTINQAKRALKKMPCRNAAIFELVEIKSE